MNVTAIDWPSVAAMLTILAMFGGLTVMLLRAQLAKVFMTRGEALAITERLDQIDAKLRTVPSEDDFARLTSGVADVKKDVAVVSAQLAGLRDGTARIEHQLDMMMRAQLEREKN